MPCKQASASAELQYNRGGLERPWPLCLLRRPSRPTPRAAGAALSATCHRLIWPSAASSSFAVSKRTEGIEQRLRGRLIKRLEQWQRRRWWLVHGEHAKTRRLAPAVTRRQLPGVLSGWQLSFSTGGYDKCDPRFTNTGPLEAGGVVRRGSQHRAPSDDAGAASAGQAESSPLAHCGPHRVTCGTLRATAFSGCVAWVASGAAASFLPSSCQAKSLETAAVAAERWF